ncbi:MAG: chaperone modulator CbpM [bacterium]
MNTESLSGIVLTEDITLTLGDLSRACSQNAEWIIELVDEGILEPHGSTSLQWCFSPTELQRATVASRLQRDLGINLPGIALVLDLMDELQALRSQLKR